jgi:hypothetical protein
MQFRNLLQTINDYKKKHFELNENFRMCTLGFYISVLKYCKYGNTVEIITRQKRILYFMQLLILLRSMFHRIENGT